MLKKFTPVILLLFACALSGTAQTIVQNPILAGFYPDPSVIKVNKDYYLVNSTFAYFPGIPVFHSRDLKNWKQIGNVVTRPEQMNFLDDRVTRGLFAPAINYNRGKYYITCTNIDGKGNFVMTATNPAGPWSNPIWLPDVRGIDPSLFFDEDKAYIVYNGDAPENKPLYSGHRTIRMYEFNPSEQRVTGNNYILVNGGVDISKKPVWIEGPHIMKRDGWYYLYAAEGGTSVNHSEVVLRSKQVTGPYVPFEGNPILTQRDLPADRKEPITSAGHAELVEGPDGRTYSVFLAVRPYQGNYYNTGRETFLAPVTWKNGWPVVDYGQKEIPYRFTLPYKEMPLRGTQPLTGNFSYRTNLSTPPDASYLFLRTYEPGWLSNSKDKGLTMRIRPETFMGLGHPSFVGKRQQHMRCIAETSIDFTALALNEKAGLAAFQNEGHFYFLCRTVDAGGQPVVQLYKPAAGQKDQMELMASQPLKNPSKPVKLRIRADAARYDFDFAEGNQSWTTLKADVDGKLLSTEVAGGFVGSLFALYGTSEGKQSSSTANFRYLYYSGNDKVFETR